MATHSDHPDRAEELGNLSTSLFSRYERFGALEDLEELIKRAEEAVAATPPDHPNYAGWLSNLGNHISSRYDRLGDLQDLEQAIKLAGDVVAATPPGHPNRVGWLDNLRNKLGSRYDRLGDLQDLEQAIKRAEEAVAAIPSEHPNRAEILNNLSGWISTRYGRLGDLQDLERAIKWAKEAVAATPPEDPRRTGRLCNLGNRIGSRYDRFGDLQDLEQAIKRHEEAAAATPSDHPNYANMLNSLGNRIGDRYDRLGNLQDLEQAIERVKEAVTAAPGYARFLGNLGLWISTRYDRLGDLKDLEQAIKLAEEAVTGTPPDHPDRSGMLSNLGIYIGCRYDRLGDLQDLEQAINRAEEAVDLTPPGHPDRAGRLNNLGHKIGRRYHRLGSLQDLEQAIKRAEEAVAATPLDHPDRAKLLNNLWKWIGDRYDRLGDLQDLEQVIKPAEEAVAAIPLGNTDRAIMLDTLGRHICRRYDRLGNLQDLERAIERAEEAVAATPPGHPNCAGWLGSLADKIVRRYNQSKDLQDLEQAIKRYEEAVAVTPSDHPDRAIILYRLVSPLIVRYQRTNSIHEFNYVLRISYEVWHCRVSQPVIRIRAARRAALLIAARKMWQESSSLLEDAVKMLPKLSSRSLWRDDQEHRLSGFSQLAAETASVALQAGEGAAHSLRFLELGRGIIMGLVIDCRSDLSDLQSKHPEVFDKFHHLRIEVDSPVETDSSINIYPPLGGRGNENRKPTYQQRYRQREHSVHDLEEALVSIRELPGFEGFQLPPHPEDLMAMAVDGPIVIFNSTEFRSDAIIVTSSAIKSLALPRLLYTSVEERMSQVAKLAEGRRSTYPQRNQKMREILLWLWDVAVEPVFNALNLDTAANDDELPRIWWIGVGRLATAPFHAAGDHFPGSTRNTISRAISSYTPTIKALSYARQKKLELSRPDPRLLLVTMPTTPGHMPLSNATKEAEEIMDVVKGKAITTRLDHPSTAQVLANLPSSNVIHFACHGMSDRASPSNSHLLLRKDDGSGALDRLTVGTISNTNIEHAQIAYLSACSTAENASDKLADESIYIASGFQLAGFSHVLATQWKSNDSACRQVAEGFYKSLFNHQPGKDEGEEGHRKVSAAFHCAVKQLRDDIPNQPIKWAPFIHTGA